MTKVAASKERVKQSISTLCLISSTQQFWTRNVDTLSSAAVVIGTLKVIFQFHEFSTT